MKRLIRYAVALAAAGAVLHPQPINAEHSNALGHWPSSSRHNLVFEDRTGWPETPPALQRVAKAWMDASGGAITITTRVGPVGGCNDYTVRASTVIQVCASSYGNYASPYRDRNNHIYAGYAWINRADLADWHDFAFMHELGHTLGMGHSCQTSVMNVNRDPAYGLHTSTPCTPSWGGGQAVKPTAHDAEAIRAAYAHSDGGVATTTTTVAPTTTTTAPSTTTTTTRPPSTSRPWWCPRYPAHSLCR